MGNVLDKYCRENKNTYFKFNKFLKNRTVYEVIPKNMLETEVPQMTSQCGAYALRAGLARLHARMRMHTSMRPGNPHARTHAQACTHRGIYNNYCCSTATMVS
jgi:hypothetical protein